jgi:hypothetical protein
MEIKTFCFLRQRFVAAGKINKSKKSEQTSQLNNAFFLQSGSRNTAPASVT